MGSALPNSIDSQAGYSDALNWLRAQPIDAIGLSLNYPGASSICQNFDNRRSADSHFPMIGLECDPSKSKIDIAFRGWTEILEWTSNDHLIKAGKCLKHLRANGFAKVILPSCFLEYDCNHDGYKLSGYFVGIDRSEVPPEALVVLLNSIVKKLERQNINLNDRDGILGGVLLGMKRYIQIGFMNGRGNIIKVSGEVANQSGRFATGLAQVINNLNLASQIETDAVMRMLLKSRSATGIYSLSLDYDLDRQKFMPRVGIEISSTKWSRGAEKEDWDFIESRIKQFAIDNTQVNFAKTFFHQMPWLLEANKGYADRSSLDKQIDQNHGRYSINPTHIKVSILPSGTAIKCYCVVIPR